MVQTKGWANARTAGDDVGMKDSTCIALSCIKPVGKRAILIKRKGWAVARRSRGDGGTKDDTCGGFPSCETGGKRTVWVKMKGWANVGTSPGDGGMEDSLCRCFPCVPPMDIGGKRRSLGTIKGKAGLFGWQWGWGQPTQTFLSFLMVRKA